MAGAPGREGSLPVLERVREKANEFEAALLAGELDYFIKLRQVILGSFADTLTFPYIVSNIRALSMYLEGRDTPGFAAGRSIHLIVKKDSEHADVIVKSTRDRSVVYMSDAHNDLLSSIIAVIKSGFFDAPEEIVLVNLGDYSGRGWMYFKTIFFWSALKFLYPDSVVLLRGNHEYTPLPSARCSSYDVDIERYRPDITAVIENMMARLPLAFLDCHQQVLALHGAPAVHPKTIKSLHFVSIFQNAKQIVWSQISDVDELEGQINQKRTVGDDHDVIFVGKKCLAELYRRMGIQTLVTGHVHFNKLYQIGEMTVAHVATPVVWSPHIPPGSFHEDRNRIGLLRIGADGRRSLFQITEERARKYFSLLTYSELNKDLAPFCEKFFSPDLIKAEMMLTFTHDMLEELQKHDWLRRDIFYFIIMVSNPTHWGADNSFALSTLDFLRGKAMVSAKRINAFSALGINLLHHACLLTHDETVVRFLLHYKADVHIQDCLGNTALHYLMKNVRLRNFKSFTSAFCFLCDHADRIDIKNHKQETFLHWLVIYSRFSWVFLSKIFSKSIPFFFANKPELFRSCYDALLQQDQDGQSVLMLIAHQIGCLREISHINFAARVLRGISSGEIELGEQKAPVFDMLNDSVRKLSVCQYSDPASFDNELMNLKAAIALFRPLTSVFRAGALFSVDHAGGDAPLSPTQLPRPQSVFCMDGRT